MEEPNHRKAPSPALIWCKAMIPKIRTLEPLEDFLLKVSFQDGKKVIYDVKDDIENLPGYSDLASVSGLWMQAQLDESRTCVYWSDWIDLPSDMIYEYGKPLQPPVSQ